MSLSLLFFYFLLLHSKVQLGRRRPEGGWIRLRRVFAIKVQESSAQGCFLFLGKLIPSRLKTLPTLRGIVCGESSPRGLQGFPSREVGFPQICASLCVCVRGVWDIFHPRWPQEAVVWPGISSAPLWEQCLANVTSLAHTLHVRTHSNSRVNTYAHTDLPPDHHPNTRAHTHTCSLTTNHISHYIALNLV